MWDPLRNRTQLEYTDLAVDAADAPAVWRPGRTTPHLSQLVRKTDPNGTATTSPTDDYQWTFGCDARGNLTSSLDPEGRRRTPQTPATLAHNADGTLASTTDPNGRSELLPLTPDMITGGIIAVPGGGFEPPAIVLKPWPD